MRSLPSSLTPLAPLPTPRPILSLRGTIQVFPVLLARRALELNSHCLVHSHSVALLVKFQDPKGARTVLEEWEACSPDVETIAHSQPVVYERLIELHVLHILPLLGEVDFALFLLDENKLLSLDQKEVRCLFILLCVFCRLAPMPPCFLLLSEISEAPCGDEGGA